MNLCSELKPEVGKKKKRSLKRVNDVKDVKNDRLVIDVVQHTRGNVSHLLIHQQRHRLYVLPFVLDKLIHKYVKFIL